MAIFEYKALQANGTATEGRKGIAYLRDHYVAAALNDQLEQFSAASA